MSWGIALAGWMPGYRANTLHLGQMGTRTCGLRSGCAWADACHASVNASSTRSSPAPPPAGARGHWRRRGGGQRPISEGTRLFPGGAAARRVPVVGSLGSAMA